MSMRRLLCALLASAWSLAATAQLLVRDVEGPARPNPADQVVYPAGVRSCANTIADIGVRAVMRAIDSCPEQFYGSRQAYLSYAKQAVLGLAVPGATEAAGALVLDKAAENAFFCISGALIDESSADEADKAYVKALLETAKENVDRVSTAGELLKLRQAFVEKRIAPYLNEGEANTFVQTFDATYEERRRGLLGDGKNPGVDVALSQAASARFDTAQSRANQATEAARGLARECRFEDADTALAQAQQLNLAYLAELRADVSRTKHQRHCIETSAQQQRFSAFEADSPFLRHSLMDADADIAEAVRLDAELTRFIGEMDALHSSIRAQRNDVQVLRQRATSNLESARQAAGECDWSRADSLLAKIGTETLACAVLLDEVRRAATEAGAQMTLLREQLGLLDGEHAKAMSTPFAEVSSCGELSVFADSIDAIPGQCRVQAGIDAKVAALRDRARGCAEFKTAQLVQSVPPPTTSAPRSTISIAGSWNSNIGYTYEIAQSGMSFTWVVSNKPELKERGEGSITESGKINASWTNVNGQGRADGTVFALDSNGRASRVQWSNGVIFERP
ncbi:MAG: hypothetical protein ACT4NL_10695 [Pseudomarimonas sp.]